jgi:hypothetical protein
VGAVFQIDPLSGAVLDTLQFPEFAAPTGIIKGLDEGLVIVDSRAGGSVGGAGSVFEIDPDKRTLRLLTNDSRFLQPRNAVYAPDGSLWIVDRIARDLSRPDRPHLLFQYVAETGHVNGVPLPIDCLAPSQLYALPAPLPRFYSYDMNDLNGAPLRPGDDVLISARIGNVGPISTLATAYEDTLPRRTHPNSIQLMRECQVIEGELVLTTDLPSESSHEITYHGWSVDALRGCRIPAVAYQNRRGAHRVRG